MGASQGGNNRLNEKPRDPWLRRQWEQCYGAGKGDARRPVDKAKFDENFERIFGKREPKVWDESDPDHPRHKKEAEPERLSDR